MATSKINNELKVSAPHWTDIKCHKIDPICILDKKLVILKWFHGFVYKKLPLHILHQRNQNNLKKMYTCFSECIWSFWSGTNYFFFCYHPIIHKCRVPLYQECPINIEMQMTFPIILIITFVSNQRTSFPCHLHIYYDACYLALKYQVSS